MSKVKQNCECFECRKSYTPRNYMSGLNGILDSWPLIQLWEECDGKK